MAKFQVGNKVLRARGGTNYGLREGDEAIVERAHGGWIWVDKGQPGASHDEDNFDLVINNNNIVSTIIEKIKLAKLGEPEKSLVKAGITTLCGELTEDGRTIFNDFLLKKFGTELKTEYADAIIAEQEKESK